MKKIFLLGAITSASLSPMSSALAAVNEHIRVYGRVDLSMDNVNNKDGNTLKQVDNSSRFSVRGVENLGAGLTGLFGLETGFGADIGLSTDPMFRHAYVGLRGGFGALALGRLDSDQATGSPLYSQVTKNVTFVVHDAGATAVGTRWLNARNRTSNAIGYMSPVWSGFSVRARYYQPDPSDVAAKVLQEGDVKATDIGFNYETKHSPVALVMAQIDASVWRWRMIFAASGKRWDRMILA